MSAMARLSLLALFTSACGQGNDTDICGMGPTAWPDPTATGVSGNTQAAYACVEQWSMRLAKASDGAAVVADAVLAECQQELESESKGVIQSWGKVVPLDPQVREYWRGKALFHIVQTRAGNCSYPET